jgi:hypothetical protein
LQAKPTYPFNSSLAVIGRSGSLPFSADSSTPFTIAEKKINELEYRNMAGADGNQSVETIFIPIPPAASTSTSWESVQK